MEIIDWVILIIVAIGCIKGFFSGVFKQLASLGGLILGLVAAALLYKSVADVLFPMIPTSMTVVQIISFVIIWLAVPITFMFLAMLLEKVLDLVCLGWLNRCLGAIFGGVKYFVFLSLLIGTIQYIDKDNRLISHKTKQQSMLFSLSQRLYNVYLPQAKEMTEEYILKK